MAVIAREYLALYSSSSPSLPPRVSASSSLSFAGRRSGFAGLKTQSSPGQSLTFRSSAKVRCQAQGVAVDVPTVTDAVWKTDVLKAEGPVLVQFYAPWCGPCRIVHPVIGELASEYAGKLKCFKLNTDDSPSIATQCGIRSVPTTLLLLNGQKQDLVLGAVPKTTLIASIDKLL